MTVAAGPIRNPYTGDGVTTIFPYTFKIFKASELQVQLDGIVAVTGYSVDGIENSSGGNVTFTFAPANGVKILFISITTRSQDTDWVENDPMSAKSVEDAFDKAMKIDKEQDEVLARALRLAPSSIYSNLLVPDPSTGKFLRWKDLTQLDNADLVPLGSLGLPVSFANGGSGANYASAAALAKGLGLSLWGGSDQGSNALTVTAGIGQLPNPLTTNIFTCSANLSGLTTAGILVGTKVIIYWNGVSIIVTHTGTFFLMARVNHTFTTGDMSEFTYVGGAWIESYRYISALVAHGTQWWRGDGSWSDIDRIKESGGPTVLPFGAIADGQLLQRVGANVVGVTGGGIALAGVLVGSASGTDYTTTSATFVDVDATNLKATVTIPTGSKFLIVVATFGVVGAAINDSAAHVQLLSDGVAQTAVVCNNAALAPAGIYTIFQVIANPTAGAGKTIALQFKGDGAAAITLGNALTDGAATNKPRIRMMYIVTT